VTLRFRGREMAHQELGIRLLDRLKGDTEKVAKVEMDARFEGVRWSWYWRQNSLLSASGAVGARHRYGR